MTSVPGSGSGSEPGVGRWSPTPAHVRAVVGALVTAVVAVLLRRPDVLVLGAPLAVVAAWSVLACPRVAPIVEQSLDHPVLREGEATTWHVRLERADEVEEVTILLPAPEHVDLDPHSGVVCVAAHDARATADVAVRTVRWGVREIGPALVVSAGGGFGAFRFVSPASAPAQLTTLPVPSAFDSTAPIAHPRGLVGAHRSRRPGDGSEFATIRPFHVGDRLRRIDWPRSTRTGVLHVTSTYGDQDTHLALVVDALTDVGDSDGIDGRASSLDISVRAAAAIAEHHLRRGDRVSMQVLDARGIVRVPPATGLRHLRRILDTLASTESGGDGRVASRLQHGLAPGSLVVLLSPLVSPTSLSRAITLSRRGLTVAVVDTLPAGLVEEDPDDPLHALAWRIRILERRREIRRVQEAGVPVARWVGPGSLDQVLRDLHRRAGAPRIVRR